jgi:hypothetical protein
MLSDDRIEPPPAWLATTLDRLGPPHERSAAERGTYARAVAILRAIESDELWPPRIDEPLGTIEFRWTVGSLGQPAEQLSICVTPGGKRATYAVSVGGVVRECRPLGRCDADRLRGLVAALVLSERVLRAKGG